MSHSQLLEQQITWIDTTTCTKISTLLRRYEDSFPEEKAQSSFFGVNTKDEGQTRGEIGDESGSEGRNANRQDRKDY